MPIALFNVAMWARIASGTTGVADDRPFIAFVSQQSILYLTLGEEAHPATVTDLLLLGKRVRPSYRVLEHFPHLSWW